MNRATRLLSDDKTSAQMTYDVIGNLQQLTRYDDSGNRTFRYQYNWHKKLMTARGPHTTMKLTYDDNGDLVQKLVYNDFGHTSENNQYSYNQSGDLLGLKTLEAEFDFSYTPEGLVAQVKRDGETTLNLSYLPTGQLEQAIFPDGEYSKYRYSDLGVRVQEQRQDGYLREFVHDNAGNLVGIAGNANGGQLQSSFTLNEDNRSPRFLAPLAPNERARQRLCRSATMAGVAPPVLIGMVNNR